jgi:hypothetical protein
MAVVHDTTLVPGKLELLGRWLPAQPWYRATGSAPDLVRAGGFRLDDPDGAVGIQVLVVVDAGRTAYLTPLTYRGAPLTDAGAALVGTSEHGVLGRRWVYDGTRDPVALAQLLALATGAVRAQHQDLSDTPDDTVSGASQRPGPAGVVLPLQVTDAADVTRVALDGPVTLELPRVLDPDAAPGAAAGWITAPWQHPGRGAVTGRVAVLR